MISLKHNGSEYVNWLEGDLLAAGIPQGAIDTAKASQQSEASLSEKRTAIQASAGDSLSLLGTTADAAAISTLAVASLAVTLSQSQDFLTFKASLLTALNGLASNQDMVPISALFLSRVQSGAVRIPVMTKDLGVVISEIEARSTAVADVLDPQS